jgi:hypothetical protein
MKKLALAVSILAASAVSASAADLAPDLAAHIVANVADRRFMTPEVDRLLSFERDDSPQRSSADAWKG